MLLTLIVKQVKFGGNSMEYDDILQALCDVWERFKEAMKKFAKRLRELFGGLIDIEPVKPIIDIIGTFTFVQSIHISLYSAEICHITEGIFKIWR